MLTALDKFQIKSDAELKGMIEHAKRTFPYLEVTSATFGLCRLMLDEPFMFADRQTPIRSSFEFLERVQASTSGHAAVVTDRDFMFAVKMFGLKVWERGGQYYFLGDNEPPVEKVRRVQAGKEVKYRPVAIESAEDVRMLEFYLFSGTKRTKIQIAAIQSATNKLLRDWRELKVARILGELLKSQTIGEAKEVLRTDYGVKDHEFVRIRQIAIKIGVFASGRSTAKKSNRATLEDDVLEYLERVRKQKVAEGQRGQLSITQLVNQTIRELHLIATGEPLPRAGRRATASA